jgi:hypothetical protein
MSVERNFAPDELVGGMVVERNGAERLVTLAANVRKRNNESSLLLFSLVSMPSHQGSVIYVDSFGVSEFTAEELSQNFNLVGTFYERWRDLWTDIANLTMQVDAAHSDASRYDAAFVSAH